ncbi:MAG: hypothetical protein B7O98_02080 [Zestosphaera tikiterensis]|uniref:UPF0201 protein B7O98_02080 n=1 Tax=Zestosphaera tikiterensis TaxID=1973259 RepID=A0A2R7Y6T5_9CREN|nr:MAG: hypothetical protein B7O98_02080 [Zestosphaera tikiterensis]
MFLLRVKAELRPTEDEEKVFKALKNLFEFERLEVIDSYPYKAVVGESKNITSLKKLHDILRQERILDAVRNVLIKSKSGSTVEFKLHKQSAYVGRVSLITYDSESPLGPIVVTISSDKIDEVIEWLAPKTVSGHPIHERPMPEVDP